MKIVEKKNEDENKDDNQNEDDNQYDNQEEENEDEKKDEKKDEVNKQLEGKNVYVIFIIKKGWLPYYFPDCEEWINISHPVNTPFILGVYFNQKCADRMIEILDLSLSTDSKKIVDFYSQEMSGSEFIDIYTSNKNSFLKIKKYNYLNKITYDHIYCNGIWINAYELMNRIERKYKRKRKLSDSDYSNNNNPPNDQQPDDLFDQEHDYTSLIDFFGWIENKYVR